MQGFIDWLTGADAGALLMVLWFVSWGLEEVPQWQALQPKIRAGIILLVSVLLAVVGVFLNANPDLVATLDPYFTPVSYVILAWLTTQTAHKIDKKIDPR